MFSEHLVMRSFSVRLPDGLCIWHAKSQPFLLHETKQENQRELMPPCVMGMVVEAGQLVYVL